MDWREHLVTAGLDAELQGRTDLYFNQSSAYWHDVYAEEGLQGLIYRERMRTALAWVDALRLPAGARILEVGCGAGLATLELASRGFTVESTDSSGDMVALTSRTIAEAGLDAAVRVGVADVHELPYAGGSFSAVIALGVLPWLHAPERGVGEMARVLAPSGHAIVTADNRLRLSILVDPTESPLLTPLRLTRRAVRRARGSGPLGAVSHLHRPSRVDRMLRVAELEPECRRMVGFGPFKAFGRQLLPERLGLGLHVRLQRLADRGVPPFGHVGWHYMVCARRANR